MLTATGLTSVLGYLAATALLARAMLAGAGAGTLRSRGPMLVWIGAMVVHATFLYLSTWTPAGLALGPFTAASLIAWVGLLVLLVGGARRPLRNLGILMLPLAAFTLVLSIALPVHPPAVGNLNLGLQIHVATSLLAAGVITLAACQTLLLAFQEQRLARHRPVGVLRVLPALKTQEGLLFQLVGAGFFLLSLSLVSGMMFVENMLAQHLAHKTVLSIVAWLIFGSLLWGRWRRGWRGRVATRLVLGGFATLALAYFGAKVVLELILDRHWYST